MPIDPPVFRDRPDFTDALTFGYAAHIEALERRVSELERANLVLEAALASSEAIARAGRGLARMIVRDPSMPAANELNESESGPTGV